MAILKNIGKRKKETKKEDVIDVPVYGEEQRQTKNVEEKQQEAKSTPTQATGVPGSVLKRPWVSEKATDLKKIGQYVFLVEITATKNEIKKAVSRRYNVGVSSVNVIRRSGKMKRWGASTGRRAGFKKAIVSF